MYNPYQTQTVKIIKIEDEGSRSRVFTFEAPRGFKHRSGQFVEVSLPGFGEAPISICSDPSLKNKFELCVRKAGMVTGALHAMKVGDKVGIRGPYGKPFPVALAQKRNLLLVAGGLGLEPLRPAIWEIVRNRGQFQKVQIFYGACDENDLLFTKNYDEWKKKIDLHVTLDKPKGIKTPVACNVGVVTTLFDHIKLYKKPVAFLCGPPVMYRFVIKKLKELNFKDEDIYLSLERRMHCGLGVCNHCAVGSFFVCQDGPVFPWAELKDIRGAI